MGVRRGLRELGVADAVGTCDRVGFCAGISSEPESEFELESEPELESGGSEMSDVSEYASCSWAERDSLIGEKYYRCCEFAPPQGRCPSQCRLLRGRYGLLGMLARVGR
jgi:hypothetical protein